ncbi:hypothetical protein QE152_g29091 [Popillia japonica]|uniref:Tc1-like transposase DDE domain-containing protein n=1 Tax=Popillia japonica TaxID=7064 RepID=A0AAW1JIQ5_POPJA
MSTSTKIGKGRILHSQAREIIANVLQFMKDEAANKCCTIPITNFKDRLIAATKIGERTSRNIVKEADDVRSAAASGFSSPSKKRKRPNPKISMHERETEVIRTIVHNFYVTEKRSPTLKDTVLWKNQQKVLRLPPYHPELNPIAKIWAAVKNWILRLPPYHPELNPIAKIWAAVKNWMAARNITFKLADVETLAIEIFAAISVEEWASVCNHVDKIVEEYMQNEHLIDDIMDSF